MGYDRQTDSAPQLKYTHIIIYVHMRKNPDIKGEGSRQEIAGFAQLDLTNRQSNLFRIHVSSSHCEA